MASATIILALLTMAPRPAAGLWASNASEGATAFAEGGQLEYQHPAPSGTWIAAVHFLDPRADLNALDDSFPFSASLRIEP